MPDPSELDLEPIPIPTGADPLAPIPIPTGADPLAPIPIEAGPAGLPDLAPEHHVEALADPSFWDSMFLWDMPVLASTIAGVLLSVLGIYIVLARAAFVSAAVSQLTSLGVVAALLILKTTSWAASELDGIARWAGFAVGILGAGLFAIPRSLRRTSSDALLAVAVIAASALTLVGAGLLTQDYQHVKNALYGDAVVATANEVIVLAIIAAGILTLEWRIRSRFLFALFDPETASAQGAPVRRLSTLLGLCISASVALATSGLGALPAFAFSVLPATTALLLTDRIGRAFWVSATLAVLAATVGYYLAFVFELPVGPTMAALLLAPLALAGLRRVTLR